jgi:hypothetical protein
MEQRCRRAIVTSCLIITTKYAFFLTTVKRLPTYNTRRTRPCFHYRSQTSIVALLDVDPL